VTCYLHKVATLLQHLLCCQNIKWTDDKIWILIRAITGKHLIYTLYIKNTTLLTQSEVQTLNWKLYRVIHKSVKYFKNSQQINYLTDHGSSYADRERNSPSFFTYFTDAQCVHLWYYGRHLCDSPSRSTCVSISRSTTATAVVIWLRKSGDQREVEAQRQCPSQTPKRKSRIGLNPGTRWPPH